MFLILSLVKDSKIDAYIHKNILVDFRKKLKFYKGIGRLNNKIQGETIHQVISIYFPTLLVNLSNFIDHHLLHLTDSQIHVSRYIPKYKEIDIQPVLTHLDKNSVSKNSTSKSATAVIIDKRK